MPSMSGDRPPGPNLWVSIAVIVSLSAFTHQTRALPSSSAIVLDDVGRCAVSGRCTVCTNVAVPSVVPFMTVTIAG